MQQRQAERQIDQDNGNRQPAGSQAAGQAGPRTLVVFVVTHVVAQAAAHHQLFLHPQLPLHRSQGSCLGSGSSSTAACSLCRRCSAPCRCSSIQPRAALALTFTLLSALSRNLGLGRQPGLGPRQPPLRDWLTLAGGLPPAPALSFRR